MNINIKLLKERAIIPTYGSIDAAGADLYACLDDKIAIQQQETQLIPTGIALNIPKGYFGAIYARSGLAIKEGLRLANCVGVIDADYTGEILVAIHNDSPEIRLIEPGERIAQIVIQPFEQVSFNLTDELDTTERGSGGFGSTGTM